MSKEAEIIQAPKLVSVRAEKTCSERYKVKYTGTFEDGSERVLRTSNDYYRSVAQLAAHKVQRYAFNEIVIAKEEFKFSSKVAPALSIRYEKPWLITIVQVDSSL